MVPLEWRFREKTAKDGHGKLGRNQNRKGTWIRIFFFLQAKDKQKNKQQTKTSKNGTSLQLW